MTKPAEIPDVIAKAKDEHAFYEAMLDVLRDWMLAGDNAPRTVLFDILENTIRRRENGALRGRNLPSANELERATRTTSSALHRTTVRELRLLVELSASSLVSILKSQEFRYQLTLLEAVFGPTAHPRGIAEGVSHHPLGIQAELVGQLSASSVGLNYLTHHVAVPHPLVVGYEGADTPAFHLSRLERYEGDFHSLPTTTKTMAGAFAKLAAEVFPGVAAKAVIDHDTRSVRRYAQILARFYSLDRLKEAGFAKQFDSLADIREFDQFKQFSKDIAAYNRTDAGARWLGDFGDAFQHLEMLASAVVIGTEAVDLWQDPDARSGLGVVVGLTGLANALNETVTPKIRDHISTKFPQLARHAVTRKVLAGLSPVSAAMDLFLSGWDAAAAFDEGDESVAIGHMLMGAGGWVMWAPLGPWGAIIGGAAFVTGAVLVVATENQDEPALLTFFRRSYFGVNWQRRNEEDVPATPVPGDIDYEWWDSSDEPRFDRQISSFFSLLYPTEVVEANVGLDPVEMVQWLRVTIKPTMAHADAWVSLELVIDEGGVRRARGMRLPIKRIPLGWEQPAQLRGLPDVTLDGDGTVERWSVLLDLNEWFGETNPLEIPELVGQTVRLSIPLPAEVSSQLLGSFSDSQAADVFETIVLRQRATIGRPGD